MKFAKNSDVNVTSLLTALKCMYNAKSQNACDLYGEYSSARNLQALYLSAFMLEVSPLMPREDGYWSYLAETITGGILDSTFKYEAVNMLKNTWNKHKKEVLQNLFRCMHLINHVGLCASIQKLLDSFSKHWLNLDNIQHFRDMVVNNTKENLPGTCSESDGLCYKRLAFHETPNCARTSSDKVELTVEHLVMAMKKVHPFCPDRLSYWIAMVKAASIEEHKSFTKIHAKKLQEFWYDHKEIIFLLIGQTLQCSVSEESSDELNLMNVSDSSDDTGDTFSHLQTPSNSASTNSISTMFQYSGRFEHHPFVELCVADLLYAVGSTIPFAPSDHKFWCKIVRKISANRRYNINFDHVATMLRCMWMLSMEGISTVHFGNLGLSPIFKSLILEKIEPQESNRQLTLTQEVGSRRHSDFSHNLFNENNLFVHYPFLISNVAITLWKPKFQKLGNSKPVDQCQVLYYKSDCQHYKFYFDVLMWTKLKDCILRTNKFATQMWKRYLLSKLRQHNPYCEFAFKSHWVCNKVYSKYIFFCSGYCKRADCKLRFKVYVQNDVLLSSLVTFDNISKSSCKFSLLN